MKPFVFFILLSVTFCLPAQRIVNYSNPNHSFRVQIEPASDSQTDCRASLILVYDRGNEKLLQTITPPDNVFACTLPEKQLFLLQDFNFDGFTDIMMPQEIPASPNIPYYYWRFNSKTLEFQRDTTLEDITSPNFDPDQKTITSFWRKNAVDHGVSTYQYLDKQLTLVEETESEQHPDSVGIQIFTHKKLVNGKLILVEETHEKSPDDPRLKKD